MVQPFRQSDSNPLSNGSSFAEQSSFRNQFGSITRLGLSLKPDHLHHTCKTSPSDFGMLFRAIRQEALRSSAEGQDFSQLFIAFSFFLVAASLLLMALLFQLNLEQRTSEAGVFLALGFTKRQIQHIFMWEGLILSILGTAIGILGAIGYAKAMILGLDTIWRGAIGSAALQFHANPSSIAAGAALSLITAFITLYGTLLSKLRLSVQNLLSANFTALDSPQEALKSLRWNMMTATITGMAAAIILGLAGMRSDFSVFPFFGAGMLFLVTGVCIGLRFSGGHGLGR